MICKGCNGAKMVACQSICPRCGGSGQDVPGTLAAGSGADLGCLGREPLIGARSVDAVVEEALERSLRPEPTEWR